METKELILSKIKENYETAVTEVEEFRGDLALKIDPEQLLDVAKLLKENSELQFVMCEDVTAVDWATRKKRFTTVYHIYSFHLNFRLRLKADIEKDPPEIESLTQVWGSANWYERETYDMYGIKFVNHPDLRRMYMPEEFEHYPLRKDFPVMGIPGSLPLPKGDE